MGRLGRVGPYTLLDRLGRGGMGEVYLAASRRGENVALKMLHEVVEVDSEARIRLEREVRALRRVESPYVACVVDADLEGDRPYLVMEHIEGDTLLERVRRTGPLEGRNCSLWPRAWPPRCRSSTLPGSSTATSSPPTC
ncbi:protein kinase [Streptosporangium lutulentum]